MRAVIGFSMGAQQAFQWAVSHPGFADRIVATAGTAKTWPHGVVRLEGQIAALTADPAFNGGDYTSPPRKGIEAYGMVWLGWLYSQEWWRREMWKATVAGEHARAGDRKPAAHVLREQRRQRSDPAGAHLATPRRRHDAGIRRRRRARAAFDHRAGALHAVGDRPLFPDRRRPVRGLVHSARLVWCRFPRCGDIRRARAEIRRTARSSTRRSAGFSPVLRPGTSACLRTQTRPSRPSALPTALKGQEGLTAEVTIRTLEGGDCHMRDRTLTFIGSLVLATVAARVARRRIAGGPGRETGAPRPRRSRGRRRARPTASRISAGSTTSPR